MSIDIERVRQWTTALRTTTKGQVEGALVRVDPTTSEVVDACCLGIGEVELCGATVTVQHEFSHPVTYVADQREPGLPHLFPRWLGIDTELRTTDLWLDTTPVFDHVIDAQYDDEGEWFIDTDCMDQGLAASWLNDEARLSFSQIADMVDYFGIRETR